MSLFQVGRIVVKIAGRDAGKKAVIVEQLDDNYVLIDGQTRRRKCNTKHLEILPQTIKISKGASSANISTEFKKLGLEVTETKPKDKTKRPRKQRKEKLKAKKVEKKKAPVKAKEPKKEEPKKEEKASSFEETLEKETTK
tara:strand:- start:20 stop:439 length:420 start_codon:yes stop_codon:yes gene_type:complete